jgi:hypothetical protein
MAEKYSMLPSEIIDRGSTLDIQIHVHAEKYKERESKKARGDQIHDTYTQAEINEVYSKWKHTK